MGPKIQDLLAELERGRAELDQERQWRQDAEAEARSERRRREEQRRLAIEIVRPYSNNSRRGNETDKSEVPSIQSPITNPVTCLRGDIFW
ncbi:hypothetical protein ACJ73_01837 [Blastomyces percursus]|uniref:Uncharacterized protein n=1 Tax=Blastomyces percursus TaxID=1658174 RepID=A0A1J9RFJ7_9EURO|nr:hypothetical protein ACJ73_01837 [Blastomyces percursus]